MQIDPRQNVARRSDYQRADKADPHLELAGRLLDQAQLGRGDHVLMRENLACYLSHQTSKKRASELLSAPPAELLAGLRQSKWRNARWITKIERDLAAPYTDTQVWRTLGKLQKGMLDYVEFVQRLAGRDVPMTIYFTGSMAKGRMGANSDVDAYADVPDERGHAASVSYFNQPDHTLSIATLPRGDSSYRSYLINSHGDMPALSGGQLRTDPRALQHLYRSRLAQRGYFLMEGVRGQFSVHRVHALPRRLEQPVLLDYLIGEASRRKLQPPRRLEELTAPSSTRGSIRQTAIRSLTQAVGAAAAAGPLAPVVRHVLRTIRA